MKEPFTMAYRIRGILMTHPFLVLVFILFGETGRDRVVWLIPLVGKEVFSTLH